MMKTNELIESIQNALFQWYDFPEGASIYTYNKETVELHQGKKYDYVLSNRDIELYEDPVAFLVHCKSLLKKDGRLLLGVNNRLGLRYFCGDKDLYTHRCFDGIEDYANAYTKDEESFQGRTYAKAELKNFLKEAGFSKCRFFSVLNDLNNPVLIYREDYLPNEDLLIRVVPAYHNPETVFLNEKLLYKSLIGNDMFHQMANAYIIECVIQEDSKLSNIQHVTNSVERGKEDAMITTIYDSGIVEKRAVYKEGRERLKKLYEYGEELREHGVKMVPAKYQNERYQMPFVKLVNGQVYLKQLLKENPEEFLVALDLFRDTVLKSSEVIAEDNDSGDGIILKHGYFDMVPLNSFFDGTDFVFYDQEFRVQNYPANVLIFRMIATLYAGDMQMEKIIPQKQLLQRYHLEEKLEKWQKAEWDFLGSLRNEEVLQEYHNRIRANDYMVSCNRDRMEYSANSYTNIFHNVDNKKIILFGSGTYAERFWKNFGEEYPVYAVVDNQETKWNTSWHGISIYSPEWLKELDKNTYKVMICVANYVPIIQQLERMGIKEYSIFDIQRLFSSLDNDIKKAPR